MNDNIIELKSIKGNDNIITLTCEQLDKYYTFKKIVDNKICIHNIDYYLERIEEKEKLDFNDIERIIDLQSAVSNYLDILDELNLTLKGKNYLDKLLKIIEIDIFERSIIKTRETNYYYKNYKKVMQKVAILKELNNKLNYEQKRD